MDRRQFEVHFAGQVFRRNTKQPYRRLVLKRPFTFPDGWIAHAWLTDPAKADQMARKLERHAWDTAVINLEECE